VELLGRHRSRQFEGGPATLRGMQDSVGYGKNIVLADHAGQTSGGIRRTCAYGNEAGASRVCIFVTHAREADRPTPTVEGATRIVANSDLRPIVRCAKPPAVPGPRPDPGFHPSRSLSRILVPDRALAGTGHAGLLPRYRPSRVKERGNLLVWGLGLSGPGLSGLQVRTFQVRASWSTACAGCRTRACCAGVGGVLRGDKQ
jgi:hypothetical protein